MPRPPSRGGVTSAFGMRVHPITGVYRMHYGEDTGGDGNYAPVRGVVVFAGYDTTGHGFGNCVGIRESAHPDRIWWTAHFAAIYVRVGQEVGEGSTHTGPIGRTGAATGIHAHQECRVGGLARPGSGAAVNPRTLYTGGASAGGTTPINIGRKKKSMSTIYWDGQNPAGGNAWWALGGDSPGTTANWITTQNRDLVAGWVAVHGPAVDCGSAAAFAEFGKWYMQPVKTTGVVNVGDVKATVDLTPLAKALDSLGLKIDALPAEIDRHADGRKQSS